MTLRFRKSIKLLPGLRLNLSGSGLGLSIGPRGSSLGISSRGAFFNAGIPGTGVSSRTKLSGSGGGSNLTSSRTSPASEHDVRIKLNDDGELRFENEYGEPLSEALTIAAKKQGRLEILALMGKMNDAINNEFKSIIDIHLNTPSPFRAPAVSESIFTECEPIYPKVKKLDSLNHFLNTTLKRLNMSTKSN